MVQTKTLKHWPLKIWSNLEYVRRCLHSNNSWKRRETEMIVNILDRLDRIEERLKTKNE